MRVLVIAAHADDEVLGCGGSIARWMNEGHHVSVLLVADGESSRSTGAEAAVDPALVDARNAAAVEASRILGCELIGSLGLPDNRLDRLELLDVVKHVESAVDRVRPDTVLTHHSGDVNIDHQVVHNAVIAACRPQPGHPVKTLLFFEVASSTEWRPPNSANAFLPTLFVDITTTLSTKMAALDAYRIELRAFPHPRSLQAVEALAKWRGATAGVEAAEAFVIGREIR